ncbi:MAG: RfaE bifunctional protein [Parcubacteria group bacterium LiPW_30]|nr:MAG: RfaE bifunctional protein [Parcubacteria group bacterium LiPW_30]
MTFPFTEESRMNTPLEGSVCMEVSPKTRFARIVKNLFDFRQRNQETRFVQDHEELVRVVRHLQEGGFVVVLTQGVYDMAHKGHFRYLEKAKAAGDFLVVGVDSDELTRQRKQKPGEPARPFDAFGDRVEMLLHTRHVDLVTVRDVGARLEELVEKIHPDVLIMSKGTKDVDQSHIDHLMKHCGRLEWLVPQSDDSTTARLSALILTGASQLAEELHRVIEGFLSRISGTKS